MLHKKTAICLSLFLLAGEFAVASGPDLSGHKGGVVVHVGCGSGVLLRQTGTNEMFFTIGLDINTLNVMALRETLRDEGFGGQVLVDEWNGTNLPFIDNFVNALILEAPCNVSSAEVQRVLVPNGEAYRLQGTNWVAELKPRPAGMDEWTHWNYSADNNRCSRDVLVGPLRRMQWYVWPFWTKYHFASAGVQFVVAGGGRVFYVVDESPSSTLGGGFPEKFALIARDAFNGKLLWRRPMGTWGMSEFNYLGFFDALVINPGLSPRQQRRFAVAGDRFYAVLDNNGPIVQLDAATGETLHTFSGSESCNEVLCYSNRVYLLNAKSPQLQVYAADTESNIWSTSTSAAEISLKNNQLCLLSSGGIEALDATTYTSKWSTAYSLIAYQQYLIHAGSVIVSKDKNTPANWVCFRASDGQFLWSYPVASPSRPIEAVTNPDQIFATTNLIWTFKDDMNMVGLDPLTGTQQVLVNATNVFYSTHHHRCHDDRATDRFFISAQEGVEMTSLNGETNLLHNWTRGPCNVGSVPANGLLYVPPAACDCVGLAMLHGLYSYAPAAPDAGRVFAINERRTTGPAFGQVAGSAAGSNDWPAYRHDAQRKSSTASFVPKELQQMWKTQLGGQLTQPVIAGGRLFVAGRTTHVIYALDANTGALLWKYAAGGTVDSSPSVWGDCVIFGCEDGRVYCLRAADGALVWRFQAAPRDCRNMQLENITSVWPVPGSVLVENGTVRFAAGHSSRLDGGLWIWSLDALTGAVLASNRVSHVSPAVPAPTNEGGADDEGIKNDIFVSDGTRAFMREMSFDSSLNISNYTISGSTSGINENSGITAEPHVYSFGNNMLDSSWNHRAVWTYHGVHAQFLIVDTQNVYGIKSITESSFQACYAPGNGYILFAQSVTNAGGSIVVENGIENVLRPRPYSKYAWWIRIPLRVQAMARAGNYLYAAGQPDVFNRTDPFAAFEGRAGGSLWTISPTSGVRLAEYSLTSPPVFDGLSAANHCLYMSAMDGSVLCLGQPESAPAAVASVTPVVGTTSTQFVFNATGSQDKDGQIVAYEWSVNGTVVSTNAVYTTSFGTVGARTIKLTVRDDDGMKGFDTTAISVTSPATDSDGDGLPDAWEIAQVGNLSMNATDDADGDGLTALQEYAYGTNPFLKDSDGDGLADNLEIIAGTSPTNADSLLLISGTPVSGGQMQIAWASAADRTYSIWGSSNLTSGFTDLVAHHLSATPPLNTFTDTASHTGPYFYRLQVTLNTAAPPPNAAPVVRNDEAYTVTNKAVVINVLTNDSDPDFQTIKVAGVTAAAHGTVTYTATNVTYTPQSSWTGGTDTFTYTVSDTLGGTASGQVTVYVKSGANLIVDPWMQQAHPTNTVTVRTGVGWCVGTSRAWQWDRAAEWSYAFCGTQATDRAMAQVISDAKATKGAGVIQFKAKHQGTGDTLKVKVYGGTSFSQAFNTETGSGTLLYDSGNIATTNFDWQSFSGTVNFGSTGYDYYLVLVWTDGIAPGTDEFMAVDSFYLGRTP